MNFLSYASWMEVSVTENNFEREHLRIIYAMFALNCMGNCFHSRKLLSI
jgi:hypothetical protein